MSKKIDTYTVQQAALALGVTPKRVRQMIKEGKLTAFSTSPVTLKQIEVLELKVSREETSAVRVSGAQSKTATASADLLAQISNLIEQSSETNRRAIELVQASAERNEQNLMAQLNELRAENQRLRTRRFWNK
jgi:hypothetical protein